MDFYESFKMAFRQLVSNKMRTLLTMLGIIIGVASITLLVSVAQGMQASVNEQMSGLGSNLVTVNMMPNTQNKILDYKDSKAFENINGVNYVAQTTSGKVNVVANNKNEDVSAIATTENYKEAQDIKISEGRFILPIDLDYNSKVVVLGNDIAKTLFKDKNPIGEYININSIPYKVIGVMEKSENAMMTSMGDSIFVPITSGQRLLKNTGVEAMYISAKSSEDTQYIVDKTEDKLYDIFGDKDLYSVFNQQAILDTMESIQGTMTIVLGSIAGISLVVAGIGIMNIMLVSVTERTKEIGIRKALGAKRKTILIQFLIESIIVSLLGGVVGAGIGIIGAKIIYSIMGINGAISWSVVGIALGFSIFVGVVFGILPANKASKLQPIQALRSE
ncbi:MAG: ABC transporter permease [Paraclostridium sp.]|uniref:ABC transporter permease n=1 Tax=Paraclostridium sp. TaxID=2023273 RepID=UPI003F311B3B